MMQRNGEMALKKSENVTGNGKRLNMRVTRIQRGLHALFKGFLSSDKQLAFSLRAQLSKVP